MKNLILCLFLVASSSFAQVFTAGNSNGGVSTSGPPDVLPTTNLCAEYTFDQASFAGGAGTTLIDQSGNNNNATIAAGVKWVLIDNGRYALNWPAKNTSTTTTISVPCANPASVIQVWKFDNPTGLASVSYHETPLGYSVLNSNNQGQLQLQSYAGAFDGAGVTVSYPLQSAFAVNSSTGTAFGSFLPVVPGGPNVYEITLPTTGLELWFNGVRQYTPGGSPVLPIPSGGNLLVGSCGATWQQCGAGNVLAGATLSFMAVYSQPLSDAQMVQVNNYLHQSYGAIGTTLAPDNSLGPNTSSASVYNDVCDTTSIEYGTGGGTAPCLLTPVVSNRQVTIAAEPSSQLQEHYLGSMAYETTFLNPRAINTIFLGSSVTNDLCANTGNVPALTVAQAWQLTQNAVYMAKQKGFDRVVLGTIMSRSANANSAIGGTCEPARQAYNVLLRANYAQTGAYLMDIAEISQLGSTNAYTNSTYFGSDLTHPTLLGEQLYAAGQSNVMQALETPYTLSAPNAVATTTYAMTPADRFIKYAGTSAGTWTLPDCTALTGWTYMVLNPTSSTLTISGLSGQPITGSGSGAAGLTQNFAVQLTSATAGGCNWQAY